MGYAVKNGRPSEFIQDSTDPAASFAQEGVLGAALVASAETRPYTIVGGEVVDQLSTTKTTISLATSAESVRVNYFRIGGASNGTRLYVVLNAASSADADTKLGLAGQRFVIPIGDVRNFYFDISGPCARIDFLTNAATETASSTMITWEAGSV